MACLEGVEVKLRHRHGGQEGRGRRGGGGKTVQAVGDMSSLMLRQSIMSPSEGVRETPAIR